MRELSYEEKMRVLQLCKPDQKDKFLAAWFRGDKSIPLEDEDLFFQVNKDRVSLDQFTERDKFKASAEDFKKVKASIDPNHKTKGSHMRLIGEIPPEIYFSRPEFGPNEPNRAKNIKKWLNQFNVFRLGDKNL